MLSQGYRISGRYEILRLVGEGGMANVYLAIDIYLKRQCAVKVLRGDLSNDEKFIMRFQREAISASSLSHPNIVELYDVGEDKGRYYIVMEYIEGKTLRQLVKARKSLSVYEVIDITKQLSNALAHAHEKNVIHRDIKPHNIIVSSDGKAKIMDFGIAMISNYTMLTNTNSIIGSVHYLSPEQVSGKGADNRSDIYSLGIVMYEMLTGEVPFMGETAIAIALEHLNNEVPSVMKQNMNVPQPLENVIRKATAKKPSNRYANAMTLHDDLDTVLNPERINEDKFVEEKPKESLADLEKTRVIVSERYSKETQPILKRRKKEKMKRSSAPIFGMLAIITILVSLILLFVLVIPGLTKTRDVVVPDVVEMDRVSAEVKLRNAGFLIDSDIVMIFSDTIESGYVISTNPKAGVSRKEGTYVKLTISKGIEKILLESYIGRDINIVRAELESKGLTVDIISEEVDASEGFEDGRIMKQFPSKGASIDKSTAVQLFVAVVTTQYPDLALEAYDRVLVEQFCNDYNLNCNIVEESHPTIASGLVIRQSRLPGSKVVSNARFTVYISTGPVSLEDPGTE